MASDLYCFRSDVTKRIPPGSISSPAGIVFSSVASTDVITFDGHGLETDAPVTVRAVDGGVLSAPLVADTIYFAIRLSHSKFKLAATAGGAAINLTSDGVSMVVTREPDFDEAIEFVSRWADGILPAHAVPLTAPIHPLVRGVVADVAAKRVQNADGKSSAIVDAAELAGKAILERYGAGIPLRGAPVTEPTNLAVSAQRTGLQGQGSRWRAGAFGGCSSDGSERLP